MFHTAYWSKDWFSLLTFFFWTSISFFSFQQWCHRYFCVSLCFQLCVGYPLDWLYFNPKAVTFTEKSSV